MRNGGGAHIAELRIGGDEYTEDARAECGYAHNEDARDNDGAAGVFAINIFAIFSSAFFSDHPRMFVSASSLGPAVWMLHVSAFVPKANSKKRFVSLTSG